MNSSVFSDEPSRVAGIVKSFLGGQTGSIMGPESEPLARLVIGGDRKDDCAAYEIYRPMIIVVGTDYVRGPKFALYELGLLTNFDIGYYVVAANVSDIAAMGATPLGVLTVVRYPNDLDDESFEQIMAGIHQAAADFGTLNVGGDIGQAERIILSATALGLCEQGKILSRSGSQPGDLLCVTGPCGILGAAVAYFSNREERGWRLSGGTEHELIESWKRPVARVAEGRLLARKPYATACQDTSDGLKATIAQLAESSGVGFEVWGASVPVADPVRDVAALIGADPLALAMSASADFQLAFTVRPDDFESCSKEFADSGLDFCVLGRAVESGEGIYLLSENGARSALPGVAWRHQKSGIGSLVMDAQSDERA
ncbi:MAG TPA: thiamine-phosphate kinase [Streptosporangiaceae bacterium]|nr:thiamine-phosphate kinase [Streptosporangiaceae bacterium]